MSSSDIDEIDTAIPIGRLRGIWRSRGYGQVLVINRNGYRLYELTAVSCLHAYSGTLEEFADHFDDIRFSPKAQSFSARRATGITRISFRRLKKIPDGCAEPDSALKDTHRIFEVFWQTFAEHYALFELKGVDWERARRQGLKRLRQKTPARQLFAICCDLLEPLRDGHVQLITPFARFSPDDPPPLLNRLEQELHEGEDARDSASYLAELREQFGQLVGERYLGSNGQHAGNRLLRWGYLDQHTGYLAVNAMAGLCGRIGKPRKDLKVVDTHMPQILDELGDAKRLVLDLRLNGGGYDGVALRLASYLMDRRRLAFTKSARRGDRFTGKQRVILTPQADARTGGELIVLTSGLTASAAEVMLLALLQRPGLTLVGEPSLGILSDAMERMLPNGWSLTLSNELYRAFDDTVYEDCGIPPHVPLPFLTRNDRESGRDNMLDWALSTAVQP